MATESKKLTINDPVDPATLKRIGEVQTRRYQLGDMMLDLKQEEVKILVEARRLDEERTKLFSQVLTQRGLLPNMPVEIDPQTGKLSLIKTNGQVQPQAAQAAPETPAAEPTPAPPAPSPPPEA